MKKLLLILLCLGLVGCATTLPDIVIHNQEGLSKLRIGMTQAEVREVMGTKTEIVHFTTNTPKGIVRKRTKIHNPHNSQIGYCYESTTSNAIVVLEYVTDIHSYHCYDNLDKEELEWWRPFGETILSPNCELTPLVFEDDKLIGWGDSFLDDLRKKRKLQFLSPE